MNIAIRTITAGFLIGNLGPFLDAPDVDRDATVRAYADACAAELAAAFPGVVVEVLHAPGSGCLPCTLEPRATCRWADLDRPGWGTARREAEATAAVLMERVYNRGEFVRVVGGVS